MKYCMQSACIGVVFFCCGATAAVNELQGMYHHQGIAEGVQTSLELGKVVFYFAQEPEVKKTEAHKQHMQTVELQFLQSQLSPAARSMLAAFAKKKSPWYTVRLAVVHKPVPMISCVITYNDEAVIFTYEKCDSIKLQKGIVLTFYSKSLLDRIGVHNKTVLRTACNAKPGIVIDVGHGGSDTGACGSNGIMEKNIALGIGLELAQLLRNDDFPVFLTRADDSTVPLDVRTTFANCCGQGDVFVSVHANAAPSGAARGIETFYVRGVEDAHVCGAPSWYVPQITTVRKELSAQGSLLAHSIQTHTIRALTSAHYPAVDRCVKGAVSQVLIGTQMPAALIEVGFVSHKEEAALLASHEYQEMLAHGICAGIKDYLYHSQNHA